MLIDNLTSLQIGVYEILLGDPRGVHWESVSGKLNPAHLKGRPVEGGKENDGTPLFIARAYHKDAVHPGKANPNFDGQLCANLS